METPTIEERLEEQRAWFHGDGDRTVAKVLSDALSSLREKDARIKELQAMLNVYAKKYGRSPDGKTYAVPLFTRAEIREEIERQKENLK